MTVMTMKNKPSQLTLFESTSPVAPLLGLKIALRREGDVPCSKCTALTVVVVEGAGPHIAALLWSNCGQHHSWLPKLVADSLLDVAKRCGGQPVAVTLRNSSKEFVSASVAVPSGASAASLSSAHIEQGKRKMVLGFNYSNGGDGSDIVPFVKYDARAGRLFRNDRKEVNGTYTSNAVDITGNFKAVIDLENIEVGFIRFAAGAAPEYLLVRFGEQLPVRPDITWKQGMRVMMKLDPTCGGDVREITSNAQAFLKGFDDLHTQYEVEKIKNPGRLPVVVLRATNPITSGAGEKKSTNYAPAFAIAGWSTRPADLVHVPKAGDDRP